MEQPHARQRLRLVRRPGAPLLRHIDTIEANHVTHHSQILESLADLELELDAAHPNRGRAADEQISFIRVGLRCLADAVAELNAAVAELATEHSDDRRPESAGEPA